MAFAAGMHVFPGGSVDPRDGDAQTAWAGPPPAEWGRRLGCAEELARALVCAAVRETFEESGVLLAGPSADAVVADTTAGDWEADRQALLDRSLSMSALLARRGLVLRSDLLGAFAHWITPEFEPRRFDTRFFLAALPVGQLARDVSGEADAADWMRVTDAVRAFDDGRLAMLPPTIEALRELAPCRDVADGAGSAARGAADHAAAGRRRPDPAAGGGVSVSDPSATPVDVPAWCTLVRADNPGPMTLDGTNTYVLQGRDGLVVVDPGPRDEQHLRRVAGHGEVQLTLLTHGHPDHAEGARRFHELTGAPVLARDPAQCIGTDEPLGEDGESAGVAGLLVDVLHTPGHTADSVCFVVTGGAGGARVARGADRRHRPRPGHHGGGPPGRGSGSVPRLAATDRHARRGDAAAGARTGPG